jgi:hypothetical protein
MDIRTAFAVLGLNESASPQQIRHAYRDLVKVWHPDRFAHDPPLQAKAVDTLRDINEAYELLQERRQSPVEPSVQEQQSAGTTTTTMRSAGHVTLLQKMLLWGVVVLIAATLTFSAAGTISNVIVPWVLDLWGPASPPVATVADLSYIDEAFTNPLPGDASTPSSSYRYASTAIDLGSRLEGSWQLNGRTLTFRQGAILVPGHDRAVAYYDPHTPQTLLFQKARSVTHVAVEVAFTPLTMRWYLRDGERRLIYEFIRAS